MSLVAAAIIQKGRLGLEELLHARARVLYDNIFSTRHLGRVLDFVLFEASAYTKICPDPAMIEYRIRHALELLIFNAWSNYRKEEKTKWVGLEFGWDDERFVMSVCFFAEDGIGGFFPGTGEPKDEVSGRMLKMFTQVQELSDNLVIRHDPLTGRMHAIVSFLSPGAAKNVESLDTSGVALPSGAAAKRLDVLNGESYQTVVVWDVGDRVAAALVASFIRDIGSKDAHDQIVGAAIDTLESSPAGS